MFLAVYCDFDVNRHSPGGDARLGSGEVSE